MSFEGLWTVDDITDIVMPGGAHFTEVIGATHNSDTTLWASGGMASAGVEDVAELGVVSALVSEIGRNTDADVVVRAGSSVNGPTRMVSGWSLSNVATFPQGVIASIRNTGRFRDNPIARLSFTSEQATDEGTDTLEKPSVDTETHSADYTVPLLVPPGTSGGPQGMLRIGTTIQRPRWMPGQFLLRVPDERLVRLALHRQR